MSNVLQQYPTSVVKIVYSYLNGQEEKSLGQINLVTKMELYQGIFHRSHILMLPPFSYILKRITWSKSLYRANKSVKCYLQLISLLWFKRQGWKHNGYFSNLPFYFGLKDNMVPELSSLSSNSHRLYNPYNCLGHMGRSNYQYHCKWTPCRKFIFFKMFCAILLVGWHSCLHYGIPISPALDTVYSIQYTVYYTV